MYIMNWKVTARPYHAVQLIFCISPDTGSSHMPLLMARMNLNMHGTTFQAFL